MNPLDILRLHTSNSSDNLHVGFSLQSHCFPHRRFNSAICRIAEMHHYSQINQVSTGLVLSGFTGVGKSTIVKYYAEQFSRSAENGVTRIPVLVVNTPGKPSLRSLGEAILIAMGDPMAHRDSGEQKTARIKKFIERCQVELIIFDEFHHCFFTANTNKFREITDWLKSLMNSTSICLIVAGLPEAEEVIKTNSQLTRRLSSRIALSPFLYEDEDDFREFRGLLKTFQEKLPLPVVTPLHEANLARRFIVASGGRLDYIRKVLEGAVAAAYLAGIKVLDLPTYASGFRNEVWDKAPDRLNPFHADAILRPLIKAGEPFETSGYSNLIGSPVAIRLGLVGRKKGDSNG
ncbi:hypothetical protein C3Y98_04410 [Methylotenera oryzisoli]|uniref:AAA+ ATPase domain-containing protein n=1 Tax=Methylotenera oryzisoli TaxID=2080758 RepID=A0A4Y9VSS5_9PROT|nr:TniB family NTP-binding protein [Methylotenera oryzisoli]TFW72354.1 hypothetical protein C3Y98_04410 [Methylotenera oryzisoli]